jgi:hypothetical protein
MYGYKTAEVITEDFTAKVELGLTGQWKAINKDDYNKLAELSCSGGLETALSRALESDAGVGKNKKGTLTVKAYK